MQDGSQDIMVGEIKFKQNQNAYLLKCPNKFKQGTNVAHNVTGGLLIDLTIVAIALLLSMSLKLTDITQWTVGAVVLEQFLLLTKWYLSEY